MVTMSAIDSMNEASESLKTEWLTEMKPYQLNWKSGFLDWYGREISVLLPSGTQYSQGTITKETAGASITEHNLIDGSSGIPISKSGQVELCLVFQTKQVNGNQIVTSKVTQTATLSLSVLEQGVSKEEALDRLKKKNVQVISCDENSLITISKSSFFDVMKKTIISDDIILQIRSKFFKEFFKPNQPIVDTPFYLLFDKIRIS